jgi:hypothetical protein
MAPPSTVHGPPGSTANNIVIGYGGGVGVVLDDAAGAGGRGCRFKAVGTTSGRLQPHNDSCSGKCPSAECNHGYGAAWCSADGIHWSAPRCSNGSLGSRWDTHQNFFRPWQGAPWVLFSRSSNWTFGRYESSGTVAWSADAQAVVFSPQKGVLHGTDAHEIYTMTGFSASEAAGRPPYVLDERHVLLGMTMIYNEQGAGEPGTAPTVDCELSMSTDAVSWHRLFPGTSFIKRDRDYDQNLLYCGSRPFWINGSVQLYYAGNRNNHGVHEEWPPWGSHIGGSLNLARLRRDGWAGYAPCAATPDNSCPGAHCNHPCPAVVSVATTPFVLSGTIITVNLEVREDGGSLRAEVRHASNFTTVAGLGLNESTMLKHDTTDGVLGWSTGRRVPVGAGGGGNAVGVSGDGGRSLLAALQGELVVLVFEIEGNAVLYAYTLGC